MICLRHPLTPAAAAGLVLAALLVPSIVASAPVDATISSTLDSGTRAALDKALNEGFAASGMPGVTVGLWIPDQGSWVSSRGVADLGTGRPMTPDLQAPIGSITKTFTVMIALQLVGESRLSLDDTINQWYPRITDASLIKVRMLMNHSSGIADISQQQGDLHCADPHHFVSPEELIQIGAALPRAPFAPGDGSLYSSVNTIILGRILEKVTNESYASLMRERLLKPLGLDRTKLDTDGLLEPPFSHGYTDFCPNLPPRTDMSTWVQFSFAAGALASTLDDLHAWGVALGEGFGLTPALRQARLDDGAPGGNVNMGLGVVIQRDPQTNNVISLGHAGSEPGYSANVQYYMSSGAVWALIGNGDGGTGEAFSAVLKALQPVVESLVTPPFGRPAPGATTPTTTPASGTSGD
jgi:D-alanyl-D-alanine carboxypeptidase